MNSESRPQEISLAEVAAYIGAEIQEGCAQPSKLPAGGQSITGLASLVSATPSQLSFVVSEKHLSEAKSSKACALICPPGLFEGKDFSFTLLIHPKPYLAYAKATELFAPLGRSSEIATTAVISDSAEVAAGVFVGANVVIEEGATLASGCYIEAGCFIGKNTNIGANTRLYANVTIYHEVVIGERCVINSGTVIGSGGFGFAPSAEGWVKIHQLGGVIIGDNVDIGANVSISRGALDDTLIGTGVIIDDLVLIAHNVEIGDHTALAGQVGIAGSTKVGKGCSMGGQVAVTGHVVIGDGVHITGKSMVTRSLSEPGQYSSGMPAEPSKEWRRNTVRLRQIEKLVDRVASLEKAAVNNENED